MMAARHRSCDAAGRGAGDTIVAAWLNTVNMDGVQAWMHQKQLVRPVRARLPYLDVHQGWRKMLVNYSVFCRANHSALSRPCISSFPTYTCWSDQNNLSRLRCFRSKPGKHSTTRRTVGAKLLHLQTLVAAGSFRQLLSINNKHRPEWVHGGETLRQGEHGFI